MPYRSYNVAIHELIFVLCSVSRYSASGLKHKNLVLSNVQMLVTSIFITWHINVVLSRTLMQSQHYQPDPQRHGGFFNEVLRAVVML